MHTIYASHERYCLITKNIIIIVCEPTYSLTTLSVYIVNVRAYVFIRILCIQCCNEQQKQQQQQPQHKQPLYIIIIIFNIIRFRLQVLLLLLFWLLMLLRSLVLCYSCYYICDVM